MAFPKGDCRPSTIAGQSVNDNKTMFTSKKKLQSTLSYKSLGEQNIARAGECSMFWTLFAWLSGCISTKDKALLMKVEFLWDCH